MPLSDAELSEVDQGYDSDEFVPLPIRPMPPLLLETFKRAPKPKAAATHPVKKRPAPAPPMTALVKKTKPAPAPPVTALADVKPKVKTEAKASPAASSAAPVAPTPKPRVKVEPEVSSDDDDSPLSHRKPAPAPVTIKKQKTEPPPKPPLIPGMMSKSEGKKPMHAKSPALTLTFPLHAKRATELKQFVAHLRAKMDEIRPFVYAREREDNAAFADGKVPSWRTETGQETTSKLLNLAHLLSTDRNFISYAEFCDITHHESLLSVLGGTRTYHVPFVRESDKETKTFDYVYDHLEEMLTPLSFRSSLFAARPEQVLAVAEKLVKYPVDLTCRVRRLRDSIPSADEYVREAGSLPKIDLINYATGNGKTWTAILGAMTEVAHPQLWTRLLSSWRDIIKKNTVVADLGLSKCKNLETHQLTRVVVALIPEGTLFDQWVVTAEAVQKAMREQLGMDFIIWTGINKLKRRTKLDPVGKDGTLKDAHELCIEQNKAMLWLVPAKTDSAKKTLRAKDSLHLHIPIRMYDEMSCRTEPKSEGEESHVIKNVIVQATVERLERATRGQKAHPLRKALSGWDFDASNTAHAAIFHLMTAPDWLRLMVSKGMGPLMPSGIRKVTIKVRLQSLAARVNKEDMNITSLDELLNSMLNNANANYTEMTNAQRKEFLDRCRAILGQTAPSIGEDGSTSEETTIHSRLQAALKELKEVHAALPKPPQPAGPGIPIPQPILDAYKDIDREKRILACMIRMLGNLSDAVCVDPPPECPISMDDIPPHKVGIFPCCTQLFNVDYKDQLNDKCPMCRAPLRGVIVATQAIDALVEAPKPPPPPPPANGAGPSGASPHAAPADEALVGDEPKLVERLESIAATKKFTMTSKAVAKTVREFLRFKPSGARILLAFSCRNNQGDDEGNGNGTIRTRELLMADVPELHSVAAVHKKRPEVTKAFTTADDRNRVLIINTADGSASLEGLDLWNTDLVIIDRLAGEANLTPAKIVQTIGRAMRPQAKGAAAQTDTVYDGPSPFPAKMIALLERDNSRPAAGAVMAEDWDEDD